MLGTPIWFGPVPGFLDPESGIGLLVFAPFAPIPLAGLIGWIIGQFIGGVIGSPDEDIARIKNHR